MIEIIELNKYDWTEQEGVSSKGKRVKGWFQRNDNGVLFLYKEPKKRDFVLPEIWTEFIAYKIGKFLGLDVPEVVPAKNEDNYGVLIESFTKNDYELIDAKELLKDVKNSQAHNIYFIRGLLVSPSVKQGEWTKFIKMMIFDCLIGNSDRHDENWGVCFNFDLDLFKLAPIYDNASCLTQQLDEIKISKMLQDKNQIEKYVINSRPPNLYLNPNDSKKHTHYEFMEHLIKTEPDMKDLIAELLQKDYGDYVDDIMANIQQLDVPEEYKLSDNRRKVILEILKLRRQKLKEML